MEMFEEEILEPIARAARFREGIGCISHKSSLVLVDLGCGPEIRFFEFAKKRGLRIKKYIGLDPLINQKTKKKYQTNGQIVLVKAPLIKKIPLGSSTVDVLTGFAFLEHIDYPKEILLDTIRVLKKGGKAIFTTPTPRAKPVLEFLSFRLKLISPREIKEHKNYFDKGTLAAMLSENKYKIKTEIRYFEFGLNNLLVIKKI
jgi:ubiquinone/menaquinone biosynthesis C-methylase UbiE